MNFHLPPRSLLKAYYGINILYKDIIIFENHMTFFEIPADNLRFLKTE